MNPLLALVAVGALFAFMRRQRRPTEKEETGESAAPPESGVPEEEPEVLEEPETEEAPEEEVELPDITPDYPPRSIEPAPGTSEHGPFGFILPTVDVAPPMVGPTAVTPGVYSVLIPGKAYLKLPAPVDNFHIVEAPNAFSANLYPADQSPRKKDPFTPFASWNLEVLSSDPGVLDVVFRAGGKDIARYVFEVLRPG